MKISLKSIVFLIAAALALPLTALSASFPECPAVGNDTSGCELLITVTAVSATGSATAFTVTTASPDQGPYDGSDDTLVGVLNSSGSILNSIGLSSSVDIFGFDGDGVCSGAYGTIPGCSGSTDPNGYAPAGVTFSGINGTGTSGTVNFSPGIGAGGSSWFSLEDAILATQITPSTPAIPEPSSLLLFGMGLLGVAGCCALSRRRAL